MYNVSFHGAASTSTAKFDYYFLSGWPIYHAYLKTTHNVNHQQYITQRKQQQPSEQQQYLQHLKTAANRKVNEEM